MTRSAMPPGDQVLEEVGKRLEALLQEEGTQVARLGGDELALIIERVKDAEALELMCARVQACLGPYDQSEVGRNQPRRQHGRRAVSAGCAHRQ